MSSNTFWNRLINDSELGNVEFFDKNIDSSLENKSGKRNISINNENEADEEFKMYGDDKKSNSQTIGGSSSDEETHELAIDIYQTSNRVYIVAPIAGVKSNELEIGVNEGVVVIKGERKNPFREHNKYLYTNECFWGKFERSFTLPSYVDTRNMSANFRDGMLLIEASRVAPSGMKLIKIN